MYLSVVIPAYNEEKRIGSTLDRITEYLKLQNYEWEILVINDGSRDGTAGLVSDISSRESRVKLIDNKINKGKGWVVKEAMLKAKGDIRLFTDADNSTSIDHIELMLPKFKEGAEMVIGSRRVVGSVIAVHQSGIKELAGRIANLWIQLLVIPGISDTQAGFKACTARAAEIIFPRMKLQRWGFDFEMLAIARKHRLHISQIPIRWVNDPNSRVSGLSYLKTLIESISVRWNLWTGVYR